jgi:16S rRNA (cytosine1402-N4)-methyltransferase
VEPVFVHEPVMVRQVVDRIAPIGPRVVVDCTLGGGGHAEALLESLPDARLVGLDRDPNAVAAAGERLARFGGRVTLVHRRFSRVAEVLVELGLDGCDAAVADLGVSSHQLDTADRGFSFQSDAVLDMRMDSSDGVPAGPWLAAVDEEELARVLRDLGEERHARRVARAVVAARPRTTGELAAIVRRIVPKARDGLDPATRTFQAIRMAVNDELAELNAWLAVLPAVLHDGGVAVAISFHSLEDRAVKNAFREGANPCVCPPQLPVCACGRAATLEVLTPRPERPTAEECAKNPRARSARLRAARRRARCA